MLFNSKFILASSSYSRYKILKGVGLNFKKVKPRCDEEKIKNKLIKKKIIHKNISLELARAKAKSVSQAEKDIPVLGSDTIISFNGALFNKAKNLEDAKDKITILSGKHHTIYSGASIFYNKKEIWSHSLTTRVKIRNLTENEIDKYLLLSGKKILSCVGCYQIEGLGPNIVEDIKGDFFNVMGLPLFPFLSFLKKYKNKNI